jgi:hypothetical protein
MSTRYTDELHAYASIDNADGSTTSGSAAKIEEIATERGDTIADYAAPPATWDSVRSERNQLLRDTDWQGMSDVTMSDAQTAYRKKLRDLPATNADPTKIVFPDAP